MCVSSRRSPAHLPARRTDGSSASSTCSLADQDPPRATSGRPVTPGRRTFGLSEARIADATHDRRRETHDRTRGDPSPLESVALQPRNNGHVLWKFDLFDAGRTLVDVDPVIAAAVERLLVEHPPATSDPTEFFGARFDAGLAWVHYAIGCGGRNADPKQHRAVEEALNDAGAPSSFALNPIGIGM